MARKGTLNIDIRFVENILELIVKNGKIPVIRSSNKGFQNYKQDTYFKRYEKPYEIMYTTCKKKKEAIIKGPRPERGCFVFLGGVQGSWVIGAHEYETIHIGYLEPNANVYATYTHKNSSLEPFSYVTAKERFEDTYKYFESIKNEPNFNGNDFDIYTEAIVDSKDIRKVAVIENVMVLLKGLKEKSFFNIVPRDEVVNRIVFNKNCNEDLLEAIGTKEEFEISFANGFSYNCDYFDRIDSDEAYAELVFETLKEYSLSGNILTLVTDYINDLKYLENIFKYDYKKLSRVNLAKFNPKTNKLEFGTSLNKRFYIEKDDFFDDFGGDFFFEKVGDDIKFFYCKNDKSYKNIEVSKEDLFKDSFRPYLLEFFSYYREYRNILSKYFDIRDCEILSFIEKLVNVEDSLNEWEHSLDFKNYTYKVSLTNNFKIEYNFVLKDFVIELSNEFYNLDTLTCDESIRETISYFENIFVSTFEG